VACSSELYERAFLPSRTFYPASATRDKMLRTVVRSGAITAVMLVALAAAPGVLVEGSGAASMPRAKAAGYSAEGRPGHASTAKADPYNWSYARTWVLRIRGKPVARVLVTAGISFNGRQARVRFDQRVFRGSARISHRRISCREEDFGPDDSCGVRTRRVRGRWPGFYLREDDDYHIDFRHRISKGRYSLSSYVKSPTFSCRKRKGADCRF